VAKRVRPGPNKGQKHYLQKKKFREGKSPPSREELTSRATCGRRRALQAIGEGKIRETRGRAKRKEHTTSAKLPFPIGQKQIQPKESLFVSAGVAAVQKRAKKEREIRYRKARQLKKSMT